MTNFKNHLKSGFSFIEVIIALAFVSIVAIVLLGLQGTLLKNSYTAREVLERIVLINNYTHQVHKAELEGIKLPLEKFTDHPPTRLTYKKRNKGKSLSAVENIVVDQITATWQELGRQRSEDIVYIRYKPELST